MGVVAATGLSEQQRELVRNLVVLGLPPELAAERAGYNSKSVYRTLRIPAVAASVAESMQLELQTAATGALFVAKVLLHDDKVSPRVRADVAFKILDRAGYIVPSRKDSAPQKALSEMSQAELLAFIERNQAEIDKAELELAGQARDITPQHAAPTDAKPLNFLD